MSFLEPLGWLGLLAIPIVVLIYIIKSKYVPKTVSSTFIWKRSMKYMKRRIPINFIMSLLLILQIATTVFATMAITQPQVKPGSSGETIVIVDASASMNTLDLTTGKTRYENAIDKITESAAKVGDNTRMSVIIAGATAQKVSGDEPLADQARVLDVIDDHLVGKCTDGIADLDGALEIAATVLSKNAGARIMLYTDKQYVDSDNIEVIDCSLDRSERNTGIVDMQDKLIASGYRYSATVVNYGENAEFTISLSVDGSVLTSKKINMSAGETREIVFTPMKNAQNEVGINQEIIWLSREVTTYNYAEIYINVDDGLVDDNSYMLYSGEQSSPKILLVSSNFALADNGRVDTTVKTTMREVLGSIGYVVRSNDMYRFASQAPTSGYDLYIYEGVTPITIPTDGAVWLLNSSEQPQGTGVVISDVVRDAEEEENPNGFTLLETNPSSETETASSIKKNVDFSHTVTAVVDGQKLTFRSAINKYRPITSYNEDSFEAIYSSNQTPVMIVGAVGTVRTIISTFDFSNSSLPFFVSDFPVLIKNMIEYSIPDPMPDRTATIGENLKFNIPAGAESIIYYYLSDENGATIQQINKWDKTQVEVPTVPLDKIGTYMVEVTFSKSQEETEARVRTYTVTTHIPRDESNIFMMGTTLDVPEIPSNAPVAIFAVNALPYIILILIVLLIIEWGVYYRDEY